MPPQFSSAAECSCCNRLRASKRNRGAMWAKTLWTCGNCPTKIQVPPKNTESKKMRKAKLVKSGGGKWKRWSWNQYQEFCAH